eukprot:gene4386-6202_t
MLLRTIRNATTKYSNCILSKEISITPNVRYHFEKTCIQIKKLQVCNIRKFSSPSSTSFTNSSIFGSSISTLKHIPPRIVRIAIVGSSVGLASPFFALGGIAQLWFYYLPKSTTGQAIKYLIGFLVGGGMMKLVYHYIGPFLANNSDFILPFALSNAIASSFWFGLADLYFGTRLSGINPVFANYIKGVPFLQSFPTLPLGGPAIGALVALTAPLLWPMAFRYCWDRDFQYLMLGSNPSWMSNAYEIIAVPVGLPVGIFSGIVLHYALQPAIYGTVGIPWQRTSLPVLGSLLGMSAIYFFFFRSPTDELYWYKRIDPKTGLYTSYNVRNGSNLIDGGIQADRVSFKLNMFKSLAACKAMFTGYIPSSVDQLNKANPALIQPAVKININFKNPTRRDISLENVEKYHVFHDTIDTLVRIKYFQVGDKRASADVFQPQYNNSSEFKDYLTQSEKKLKVNDLLRLSQDLEHYIIVIKKSKMIEEQLSYKSLSSNQYAILTKKISSLQTLKKVMKARLLSGSITSDPKQALQSNNHSTLNNSNENNSATIEIKETTSGSDNNIANNSNNNSNNKNNNHNNNGQSRSLGFLFSFGTNYDNVNSSSAEMIHEGMLNVLNNLDVLEDAYERVLGYRITAEIINTKEIARLTFDEKDWEYFDILMIGISILALAGFGAFVTQS